MADERNAELRADLKEFARAVNLLAIEFQKKHGPPPIPEVQLVQRMGEEFPRVIRVHAVVNFGETG